MVEMKYNRLHGSVTYGRCTKAGYRGVSTIAAINMPFGSPAPYALMIVAPNHLGTPAWRPAIM